METKQTASNAILERLADGHRRVLADWRAVVLLRRATFDLPAGARRWSQLPRTVEDVAPLLRQMQRRGEIKPVPRLTRVYEVTVPYARSRPTEEDEVLMEVHPYAALSHLSAFVHHGLTDQLPKRITTIVPADGTGGAFPPDTDATDWEGIDLVRGRTPDRILALPVHWTRVKAERAFGFALYRPRGYPIRATTPERTLLDGLLEPQLSGGIQNVLRGWFLAGDLIRIDEVVRLVDRFDVAVLRQRVGFVLDELGLSNPAVEAWRPSARRGGSSRLLGAAPYAPSFSERWNLSLNAPTAVLREGVR